MKRIQIGRHSFKWIKEPKDYILNFLWAAWNLLYALSVIAFWGAYCVITAFLSWHLTMMVLEHANK